ncbi:MAG: sulfatase-like hydrolase/transferase [Clostridia bacterium]|nr:sulfatase-like hydrolase/transferase [Clostridia bacterium]
MKDRRRLSVHSVLPGFLFAFTLFVFAPVDLYFATADELWFSPVALAPWLLAFATVAFVTITFLSCVLPQKFSIAFRAGVYACSFLMWLQGNVLVTNYGTLDGSEIDWSVYRLGGILNALLWVAVIVLFIFLMFRLKKKFRRIVEIAACILLITQVITLGVLLIQYKGVQPEEDRFLSRKNELTVSAEKNVLVFVPDTFDGYLMTQMLEKYPEETAEMLPDFTFYPDTVAGAARTKYAIPFILTGDTNREEQSYMEYLVKGFETSPLIRELEKGKYSTGFYTYKQYIDMSRDDAIDNVDTGVPEVSSGYGLTKQFMKMVALRYAPSLLVPVHWMYTGDFERWKSTDNKVAYSLNDAVIYHRLTSLGLTASAEKPCFRFYHLVGAHGPYVLDRDLNNVTDGNGTEEEQALGTLKIISEYMEQLKKLGVYDQTTVIVLADHGYGGHSYMEYCPLLMIKYPGTAHAFEISDIPISYISMAEIMTEALQGELSSLEKWRQTGPRYYYYQNEKDGILDLTEYVIDSPGIGKELKPTGFVYHGDTLHKDRSYVLGTKVYFDSRETAGNYQISGFCANEGYYTWTSGNTSEMLFEIPETSGMLEMILEYGTFFGEQTVNVWVNDRLVDIYYANGDTIEYVTIPEGTVTGKELRVRLELPDACSPAEAGLGEDVRQLALSMQSLVIREAEIE